MKLSRRIFAISMAAGLLVACGTSGMEGDGAGGSSSGGAPATAGTTGHGGTGAAATSGSAGTGAFAGAGASAGSSGGGPAGTTGQGAGGTTGGGVGTTGGTGGIHAGGTTGGAGTGSAGSSGGAAGVGGGTAGRGSGGAAGRATAGSTGSGGSPGAYNPCPTNGDPCRILPVGDSITFGINYAGSYRPELFHKALMAGQKITYTGTLMNGPTMVDGMAFPQRYEATSGITIDGISMQITKNKTLNMPADIVLIHIGTNDMYMSDPGGAPDRLGKLIDQIATGLPSALIAVAKIIPLQMSASQVATFNGAIPGVVAQRVAQGKHVIVVDLNTGFPAGDMDSVHPYQSGYNWMGDKWYDAIGSLFPK